jgi:hypothetical protein
MTLMNSLLSNTPHPAVTASGTSGQEKYNNINPKIKQIRKSSNKLRKMGSKPPMERNPRIIKPKRNSENIVSDKIK